MSTKYNTRHPNRARSHYPDRLAARGLAKTPVQPTLDDLRKRQQRRIEATCSLGPQHDSHECNGFPWPSAAELGAQELEGVAA